MRGPTLHHPSPDGDVSRLGRHRICKRVLFGSVRLVWFSSAGRRKEPYLLSLLNRSLRPTERQDEKEQRRTRFPCLHAAPGKTASDVIQEFRWSGGLLVPTNNTERRSQLIGPSTGRPYGKVLVVVVVVAVDLGNASFGLACR